MPFSVCRVITASRRGGERRGPHGAGLCPYCAELFLARLLRASHGWKEREGERLADSDCSALMFSTLPPKMLGSPTALRIGNQPSCLAGACAAPPQWHAVGRQEDTGERLTRIGAPSTDSTPSFSPSVGRSQVMGQVMERRPQIWP